MAVTYLPYLLFGLLIGAVADRVDRKRMLIVTDQHFRPSPCLLGKTSIGCIKLL